jgi:hypothetical protein
LWTVLLAFVLPFFAAWWWWASYDVRFLVTIVPTLSVMAAVAIDDVATRVQARIPLPWRTRAAWLGAAALAALAILPMQQAVQGKRAIFQNPFMTDLEKHRVRLGGVYDLALAINRLPEGSRVLGVPALSVYHLDRRHASGVSLAASEAAPWDVDAGYDFVVYDFGGEEKPGWAAAATPILETDDGYSLYSTEADGPG